MQEFITIPNMHDYGNRLTCSHTDVLFPPFPSQLTKGRTMTTIRQASTRRKMKEVVTNPNRVSVVWEWDGDL